MKEITVLVCCLFALAATAFAQASQGDAPAVVQNSMKAKYPGVQVKDWDYEDEKDMYEAEFKMNNKEYEAYFSSDGQWMKTKRELKKEEVPAVVTSSLSKGEYATWNTGDRYEIDTPDGKMYKLKAEKDGKTMYLKFNANGELVDSKSKEDMKSDKKHGH